MNEEIYFKRKIYNKLVEWKETSNEREWISNKNSFRKNSYKRF